MDNDLLREVNVTINENKGRINISDTITQLDLTLKLQHVIENQDSSFRMINLSVNPQVQSHQNPHLKAEKAYAIDICSRNRTKTTTNCTGEEGKFEQLEENSTGEV